MTPNRRNEKPHSPLVRTLKVGDRYEIRRRWWRREAWMLLGFAVIWSGIMLLFIQGIVRGQATGSLCGLGFLLAIGVGLGAYAVALAVNETRIYAEGGLLHVAIKPLTLCQERLYRLTDIVDVRASVTPIENIPENAYAIQILTVDGEMQNIASNINDGQDAIFIEEELKFILEHAPESAFKKKKADESDA